MTGARLLRTGLAAALAAITLASSAAALVALEAGGEARLGAMALLKLAAGYDRRAEPILAPGELPPASQRREAARLARGAIAQFPYDTGAWLRLAYVDVLDNGRLSPAGLAALRRSYDLIAVDPDLGVWRVGFALENSQALPPEVRTMVRNEASALWTNPQDRSKLHEMQRRLRNPAGRLSLALWLNRLAARMPR